MIRVNAVKTGHHQHNGTWREYDGGKTNIDVYRWTGGREVDFSSIPDFDPRRGSAGDTLIWYPRTNELVVRHHSHQYKPLCYQRKIDGKLNKNPPQNFKV